MGATPKGISGSRAAAVMGLSSWSTPYQVWCKIAHEQHGVDWMIENGHSLPTEEEPSTAAKFGLAMEDAIAIQAIQTEMCHGSIIEDREKQFGLDAYTNCHVDGIFKGADGHPVWVHEGKTTSSWAFRSFWGQEGTDEVPPEYQIQAQHNMMCSGLKVCVISVLVWPETADALAELGWEIQAGTDGDYHIWNQSRRLSAVDLSNSLTSLGYFHQYRIEADPQLQKMMRKMYGEFWESVIKGDAPPSRTADEARARLKHIKGVAQATPELEAVSLALGAVKERMKSDKAEEAALKKQLMEYMRNNAEPTADAKRLELISQDGTRLHTWNGRQFR